MFKYFKLGKQEVPPIIKQHIIRHYIAGGVLAAAAVLVGVVLKSFLMFLIPSLVGLAIAGIGYIRLLDISKNGYSVIEGVCEKIESPIDPAKLLNYADPLTLAKRNKRNQPVAYLVRGSDPITQEEQLYHVPYVVSAVGVEVDDHVRIYLAKNTPSYERNGVTFLDSVLAYELM